MICPDHNATASSRRAERRSARAATAPVRGPKVRALDCGSTATAFASRGSAPACCLRKCKKGDSFAVALQGGLRPQTSESERCYAGCQSVTGGRKRGEGAQESGTELRQWEDCWTGIAGR
jgi:hypothetical protein